MSVPRSQAKDATAMFGERLFACRRLAGMSQEELAEQSGLSIRTVRNLERGKTKWPHPSSVRRLADALELHDHKREEFIFAAGRHLAGAAMGSAVTTRQADKMSWGGDRQVEVLSKSGAEDPIGAPGKERIRYQRKHGAVPSLQPYPNQHEKQPVALADPVSADLKRYLRSLKLGQILTILPARLALARQQNLAHADFLELLLAYEVTHRENGSTAEE